MMTNSFSSREKVANAKRSPGLVFRMFEEDGSSKLLPKHVDGIHMLSTHLFKLTLEANGFKQDDAGITAFVDAVLKNDVNKNIGLEDAIEPLAEAIAVVFNVQVEGKECPLNIRTKRQIIYGIRKEIECALEAEKRL
jgi:hypothetical protein